MHPQIYVSLVQLQHHFDQFFWEKGCPTGLPLCRMKDPALLQELDIWNIDSFPLFKAHLLQLAYDLWLHYLDLSLAFICCFILFVVSKTVEGGALNKMIIIRTSKFQSRLSSFPETICSIPVQLNIDSSVQGFYWPTLLAGTPHSSTGCLTSELRRLLNPFLPLKLQMSY